MINFLKQYGIVDTVIKEIENVNSSANLYNLSCNQDEIAKIIQFLREIGVNCIDQLLIYRIDLFFESCDNFKKLFNEQDINKLVELINDDYMIIDKL